MVNEVLDKPTVMTLYKMITDHIIAYVNGAVSAGKESVLFWGVDENDSNVALKIYLVSTSNFKNVNPTYLVILDSQMSKRVQRTWYIFGQKEFRNLTQCFDIGIPIPKPLHVSNNVLAMEFVGENGAPEKLLLDSQVDEDDYIQAIQIISDMYHKAKLVHGDFSEYNIFKTQNGLLVFDLGSAVDLRHPNTQEFLKRDINNITNSLKKRSFC